MSNRELLRWSTLSEAARRRALARPGSEETGSIDDRVREILAAVREEGDLALRRLGLELDGARLESLEVSEAERATAREAVSAADLAALRRAADQIERFHAPQRPSGYALEVSPGVRCSREVRALDAVGLYVPGGSAPLPSTVLMLGLPARLAGCPRRLLCTPPRPDGSVDPSILVAAELAGVQQVFKLGGAQAVAALAFGTESVPAVAKIFGPGNRWVTRAKQLCAQLPGGVAIDLPAGPSEVLVIADGAADPALVAADLLSQAEHGPDSQVILVTTDAPLAEAVGAALQGQLEALPRREIARAALEHATLILVEDLESAFEVSNRYAPEHLILQLADARSHTARVQNAGSVFLGPWTPESVGDYASGTNHVLPTDGWARSTGGLSVADFCKTLTFQEVSPAGLRDLGPVVQRLADLEGLAGHERAVGLRLERLPVEDGLARPPVSDRPVASLARPAIREMRAYASARSLVEGGELLLDANEAPEVLPGVARSLNRYPEPQPRRLVERLAALYRVAPGQLMVGRGADEAIEALVRTFCEPKEESILVCPPTYGVYALAATVAGARVEEVDLDPDFAPRLEAILSRCRQTAVKLVFLCSPNNPTGNAVAPGTIETLCAALAGQALVVVDEAYLEFSGRPSVAGLLGRHENLVVLRTLSKAWGLAGARVGVALAREEVIALLQKVRAPYPLSRPAIDAVEVALSAGAEACAASVAGVVAAREGLATELARLPSVERVFPSEANFLLVRLRDPAAVLAGCRAAGIVLRDRSDQPGLAGCVRITVGSEAENRRLLETLAGLDGEGSLLPGFGGEAAGRPHRRSRRERRTRETDILVEVDLDGEGTEIATGLGFFDHMLEQIGRHGAMGLKIQARGDLEVDEHHTVEDVALTLGAALREALGDKAGIGRYGFTLPMDESLARVALDLSGRAHLEFSGDFSRERVGDLPTELVPHFFRSLADALGATLHLEVTGENAHHQVEACFKAVGRCLGTACVRSGSGLPSTKGIL